MKTSVKIDNKCICSALRIFSVSLIQYLHFSLVKLFCQINDHNHEYTLINIWLFYMSLAENGFVVMSNENIIQTRIPVLNFKSEALSDNF